MVEFFVTSVCGGLSAYLHLSTCEANIDITLWFWIFCLICLWFFTLHTLLYIIQTIMSILMLTLFLFFHSQNCTIKCACLTSHYEGASSAQSKTEETGLKRLCVCVDIFCVCVRLRLPFVYWANAHVWVSPVVCICRVSAVWICWCVNLLPGWMSEG